jgi:hypothetical protein
LIFKKKDFLFLITVLIKVNFLDELGIFTEENRLLAQRKNRRSAAPSAVKKFLQSPGCPFSLQTFSG